MRERGLIYYRTGPSLRCRREPRVDPRSANLNPISFVDLDLDLDLDVVLDLDSSERPLSYSDNAYEEVPGRL